MRYLMIVQLFAVVLLAGCAPKATREAEPVVATGWVPSTIFTTDPGHEAFKEVYQSARIDTNLTGMIRGLCQGVDVLVFYGQWCSDSKHEVPRFLRLVEASGWEGSRVRYYALDRSKKSDDGLTNRYAIEKVPTLIFFRNDDEIGRIVEVPRATLEGDIVQILVAKPH